MKQLIIATVVAVLWVTSMSAQTVDTSAVDAARHRYHGAPGPVIGAGLPALAIGIGYGVYWLRKRRRRAD
jgi:hypothetical protein